MASYTEHLQLLKKDPVADGADTFNIQTMLNDNWDKIDEAVAKKAELGADGKIPAEQLPEMDFDKAGSAAAVQGNLDAHTGNKNNPHAVTAAQVGAATTADLSGHTGNRNNPHAVTAAQVGADPVGSAAAVQQALASQIAALTSQLGGKAEIQTGSYVGTGTKGGGSTGTNTLRFSGNPKVVMIIPGENSGLTQGAIFIRPASYTTGLWAGSGTSETLDIKIKWVENGVEWYSTKNAPAQLNTNGDTYYWAALL